MNPFNVCFNAFRDKRKESKLIKKINMVNCFKLKPTLDENDHHISCYGDPYRIGGCWFWIITCIGLGDVNISINICKYQTHKRRNSS